MSRHSIKNTLRQCRGARNAAARTEVRYAKRSLIARRVRAAIERFNQAERELKAAVALAWADTDARSAA